ncbi:MAG: Trk system potassium transporter TrkA [Aristaeellaceae bacterium]
MRILIVGNGKVGHTLAEQLIDEGHDVIIIDKKDEVIQKAEDLLDAMCIHGNGANAKTLLDAGVEKSDIVVAATASDETNMLCCLLAKRLGAKYTIARIRDPEYNESLTLLQHEIGLDMTINPERATALEISQLLRFPYANNVETFAKGHVELVEFRAQEGDSIVGHPLKELPARHPSLPRVLYCAVERDGVVTIPNGDFTIRAGDRVHVAGELVTVSAFFRVLGRNAKRVRNVMLLGGGRISYYLARLLTPAGIHVTMFEKDEIKAEALSEQLPHVDVIAGDGTDQELLEQENLAGMDAFISLSDRDEENLMTGLYAQQLGVQKVVVKNNRQAYNDVIYSLGLDSLVSPRIITCNMLLRYVRARVNGGGTSVEKLYRLVDGKAEALEFIARREDPYIGIPLKALHTRPGTLVAIILHRGKVIIPFGNDTIQAGDNVVIISNESGITDLNEVISR